jgi:hypothetical protein
MSREQRTVAGWQAVRSCGTSNVKAIREMELPGRQRGEMSSSVEVGPELGKGLAWRRRCFVGGKRGACGLWIQSEDEGGDDGDPQH